MAWLVARDRCQVRAGQALVLLAAVIWIGQWLIVGRRFLKPENALLASVVLHQALNWIIAYSAGKRFAEERQSGGFEVLLTTPLRVDQIIAGQTKGLIAQFKRVWVIVVGLNMLFAFGPLAVSAWKPWMTSTYVLAWALPITAWFAMHFDTASRAMWIGA